MFKNVIEHVRVMLLQLCPTLCDPVNCSPPGVLSMGFSRQEYWSGLPCPPPDLPNSGVKPAFLTSPALAGRFFTTSTTWEALKNVIDIVKLPSGCWANLYFCHQHELLPNGSCRRENIKVWSLLIVCERLPWFLLFGALFRPVTWVFSSEGLNTWLFHHSIKPSKFFSPKWGSS